MCRTHCVLVAVVLGLLSSSVFSQERKMYWTDSAGGRIQRANLDGAQVEDVLTGLAEPWALAADLKGRRLYWSERSTGKIRSSNFDGSGVVDVISGLDSVVDMAIDADGGMMYWAQWNMPTYASSVRRAMLDGTGMETLHLGNDTAQTLTVGGGRFYTGTDTPHEIRVADLDGSNDMPLLDWGLGGPWGLAFDAERNQVYCIDEDNNRIVRLNADGSENELDYLNLLAFPGGSQDDSYPGGLAFDAVDRMLYWTDNFDKAIRRLDVDIEDPDLRVPEVLVRVEGIPQRCAGSA